MGSSSSSQFDSFKFRSSAHENWFRAMQVSKKVAYERALKINDDEHPHIVKEVTGRGWIPLFNPMDSCVPIVQEFYANARRFENDDLGRFKTKVRGVIVDFSPTTINNFLGLSFSYVNYCQFFLVQRGGGLDYDDVLKTICKPDAQWILDARNVPFKLGRADLLPVAKAWCALIQSNILPTTNMSDVNLRRATLIYCIMKGDTVKLAKLIADNIESLAQTKHGNLGYPSLITVLSITQKVPMEGEIMKAPPRPSPFICWTDLPVRRHLLVEPQDLQGHHNHLVPQQVHVHP